MRISRRAVAAITSLAFVALAVRPGTAAAPPAQTLRSPDRPVTWSGVLATPDPLGCGASLSAGCDITPISVTTARGSWITVTIDVPSAYLRVEKDGTYVADGGVHVSTGPTTSSAAVTFQHLRTGQVTYSVGVSHQNASAVSPVSYRGTARLAGGAFDRAGQCGVTTGAEHLLVPDDGRTLSLAVRLVAEPRDRMEVQTAGRMLSATYKRIGIQVRLSYDFIPLKAPGRDAQWYDQVRARYGGKRPPTVDVVHVMTDGWAGGVADCIGGIAYPERAFSVGSIRFTSQGVVPVPGQPQAPAALVAAHEIGHLLGAQHQQVSCIEAAPQLVAQPPESGWIRPCTLMGPVAQLDSEVFSTLERSTVRSFLRAYGRAS